MLVTSAATSVTDVNQPGWLPSSLTYRILAWGACALLLLAHGPGAVFGRLVVTQGLSLKLRSLEQVMDIGNPPGVENQDVIVINSPSLFMLVYVPFAKASAHQPLPRTLRTLLPGCTTFELDRTDERTLVARSKTPNIFSCEDVGPVNALYALRFSNVFLGEMEFKQGERFERGGLVVEILELDAERLPSRVAFRFNASLDSPSFHWMQFNFDSRSYEPFAIPSVGQRVTVFGPVR